MSAQAQGNLWNTQSAQGVRDAGVPVAQTAPAALGTGQAADSVLQEMERAFNRGQSARLTQLLPAAAGHPLQVYAEYWELKARLETASPQEIRAFMQRWQSTYFEDRLRNDWLLLLGKNGDAINFAQEWPLFRMRDDATVRCWATAFGLLSDSQRFLDDWQAMRGSNEACEAGARRLLASGQLKPLDVWRKARLAASFKQLSAARDVVAVLDEGRAAQLRLAFARSPAALMKEAVDRQVLTVALSRLAAENTDAAINALQSASAADLSAEQRDWVWGTIGQQAAMGLSGAALSYYGQAQGMEGWSQEMLAWRVRAALRAGLAQQAPVVLQSIAAMSPSAQQEPVWVYWKARALAASGTKADAQQAMNLYRSIASVQGFYEMLALEETGSLVQAPLAPPKPTAAEMARVQALPGLARAVYAIQLGVRSFGVREWNYTAHIQDGGLPPRDLLAAAEWACQLEIWDRCINTAERNPLFATWQRYPMPHRNEVLGNSATVGMDAAYVYGLIRQESRFITAAHSGVGASGLMQIMPATARWTARKIGLVGFSPDQVYDSQTNVLLGVNYLHLALESFQDSKPLAAAAYNAGPGRPRRWRMGAGDLEGAIWAENIPFAETRDYVKKVLANTTMYAALIAGRPQSLKAELGTVGPATTEFAGASDLP